MGMEELGTLDLSGADMSAGDFTPIPAAAYDMHVHDVKVIEVQKDGGNLPKGTPGFNIQFRVDGGKYDNRVVFTRYYIPPADYDAKKRATSLGIFANFLKALGYSEEEIKSGSFQSDPMDWMGKQVKVSVKVVAEVKNDDGSTKYPAKNEVSSVKALTGEASVEAGIL